MSARQTLLALKAALHIVARHTHCKAKPSGDCTVICWSQALLRFVQIDKAALTM